MRRQLAVNSNTSAQDLESIQCMEMLGEGTFGKVGCEASTRAEGGAVCGHRFLAEACMFVEHAFSFEMLWSCFNVAEEVQIPVAGPWQVGSCDVEAYAIIFKCSWHRIAQKSVHAEWV